MRSRGTAIAIHKENGGSVTVNTAGLIQGDINIHSGDFAVTVRNQARGVITGDFRCQQLGEDRAD